LTEGIKNSYFNVMDKNILLIFWISFEYLLLQQQKTYHDIQIEVIIKYKNIKYITFEVLVVLQNPKNS